VRRQKGQMLFDRFIALSLSFLQINDIFHVDCCYALIRQPTTKLVIISFCLLLLFLGVKNK
jgi:hypothetical protein